MSHAYIHEHAARRPQAVDPHHHKDVHHAPLTLQPFPCSGPLPSNDSGVPANSTNFFPSLRAMNISHNAFTGTLPTAFGQAGVFNQKPLQFADGEILMHVFDVSYNQLSGVLPSFLDFTNVPEYVQRGIFIAVSHLLLFPGNLSYFLSLADDCSQLLLSVHAVTSRMGLGGMHHCAWQCCRPAVMPSVLAIVGHHASHTHKSCKGCFVCPKRVTSWKTGIHVQGNNFTYSCGAQQSYINDICLSSAPAPSQLPPMGTSTSGSRTASSGLPSTNQTLPANNGSLPGQMQYPGGTYPGSQGSPPQNPSNPSTASASADGNPVDTQA